MYSVDNYPAYAEVDRFEQYKEMRSKLCDYGLDSLRIDVIVSRVLFEWTFKEIATEYGIVNARIAHYLYKSGLEVLKERGFR